MMGDIFGIDVSSYQGTINWKKVKQTDVKFAILKVIRKDLNPDKQFENNWRGCTDNGIEIQGVYNYSYATSVTKAVSDANKVLKILNGRQTMVWLDVEDNCQKGLKKRLIDIIMAYGNVITKAGLKFGVYTGASFYNTYIKPYATLPYALWIASYGTNNGKAQENKRPRIATCIGWQYSSRGRVDGVAGNVDVNVFFGCTEPKKTVYAALPTIKSGSNGTQALILQQDLNHFGYRGENGKPLTLDGKFGKNSVYALKNWQKANKLTVDGIYGSKSYTKMKGML